jgi:4-amino-4-deoxy-L-arabinose transferase-like glycosyltransferase
MEDRRFLKCLPFIFSFLLLFLLCLFLFFHRLADRDLWSSHEARAAMDAQSILNDGSALPRLFDGRAEVQKPPLYYWLVAGIAGAHGGRVDAWSVRLPAALAALGCVMLLAMVVGWGCARPREGLLSAAILATSIGFTWLARIGRIDMPLTLTASTSSFCFLFAIRAKTSSAAAPFLLIAYLAIALGVLLKGPIGLVLPLGVVAGYLLMDRQWPAFWELSAWRGLVTRLGAVWGLPLVLAIVLPVFVWMEHASGGEFFREFFWRHNVERGLGGPTMRSHHWWLYGPFFLLYFLPWTPMMLIALGTRGWRGDPLARFGLAWCLAVLVVLSASRFKRADYLLPAYPGAALFLACALPAEGRWGRLAPRWVGGVATLMALGWLANIDWVLPAKEPFQEHKTLAGEIRRASSVADEVIFFRTEAHALAFHVGRPLSILVEWSDLEARLRHSKAALVVMPGNCAQDWSKHLHGFGLTEVARNRCLDGDRDKRLLVVMQVK